MAYKATRKFNGSKYHLFGSATKVSKKVATSEARGIRAKGRKARVVKVKGGYNAYGY